MSWKAGLQAIVLTRGKAMDAHEAWIDHHVSDYVAAYGKCADVTEAMQAAFPELQRVRGHYYDAAWGERAHWWLVTPDGNIVDPTAKQFPTHGAGVYVPWEEGQEEPTGMCPNCGESCYGGRDCCSDECYRSHAAYLYASVR